jgi:hypothetical protein
MQAPLIGQYKPKKKRSGGIWSYFPNYGLPYVSNGVKIYYLYCLLEDPHTLHLPETSARKSIKTILGE